MSQRFASRQPAVRPALLSALAVAVGACGTPQRVAERPAVVVPAPPPVAAPALPPRAEPPAVEPTAPPEPPAAAPQGTIETRSVYPQGSGAVVEWTLANGASLVYAYVVGAEGAYAVAFGPGGAVLLDAPAASVEDALAAVRRVPAPSSAVTAVVAGSDAPDVIEGAVGRTLAGRWLPSADAPAPPVVGRRVRADIGDDGALVVLAEAVRRRGGAAEVALDPGAGTATLAVEGGAGTLAPFSRAEAEAARAAVAAEARRRPVAFAARALADLYRAPGPRRPARPPAFALDRLRRVEAVSADALTALAARFAAARPAPPSDG